MTPLIDCPTIPHRSPPVDGQKWMIILVDLLALILTFLVMIFGSQSLGSNNWERIALGLSDEFDPGQAAIVPSRVDESADQALGPALLSLDYLYAILENRLATDPSLGIVQMTRTDDRIVLSLDSRGQFSPRTRTIAPDLKRAVQTLAGLLSQLQNQIVVLGRGASGAPDTALYSSNWQLSLWKALAVRNELKAAGYPGPLFVLGDSQGLEDRVEIEIRNRRWIGHVE